MLEDAQEKFVRVQLPVSDAIIIGITTKSLIQAQAFPNETIKWEKYDLSRKTWAELKTHYLEAHEGPECQIQVSGGADQFGSNSAATSMPVSANAKQTLALFPPTCSPTSSSAWTVISTT